MVARLSHLRRAALTLAASLLAGVSVPVAAADGLSVADGSGAWPRWQARLGFIDTPARFDRLAGASAGAAGRAAVLGDIDLGDFGLTGLRAQGRFRATGGLLVNPRPTPGIWVTPSLLSAGFNGGESMAAPYLGLGYSGWLHKTGLSFTADIGVTAESGASSLRLGRALFGYQGQDASMRELRLQPRLQLGVHYRY